MLNKYHPLECKTFLAKSTLFLPTVNNQSLITWNKYLHISNQGVFSNVHFLNTTSETWGWTVLGGIHSFMLGLLFLLLSLIIKAFNNLFHAVTSYQVNWAISLRKISSRGDIQLSICKGAWGEKLRNTCTILMVAGAEGSRTSTYFCKSTPPFIATKGTFTWKRAAIISEQEHIWNIHNIKTKFTLVLPKPRVSTSKMVTSPSWASGIKMAVLISNLRAAVRP